MHDLITVIVPVFNAQNVVGKCVESILGQEYANLEILLIDDGSTDGSLAKCRAYAEKDARITVIDKSNSGVSATRNFGISKANGKYIAFVDADDRIDKAMYRKMHEKACETDADLTFCRFVEHRHSGIYPVTETALRQVTEQRDLVPLFLSKNNVMGSVWRILMKADICKSIAFDEDLSLEEDKIFVLDAITRSKALALVDDHLYHYNVNEDLKKYFSDRIFDERKRLYAKEARFFSYLPPSVVKAEKYRIYLKTALSVLYNSDDCKAEMARLNNDPFFHEAKRWIYLLNYMANESPRDGFKALCAKLRFYGVLKRRIRG